MSVIKKILSRVGRVLQMTILNFDHLVYHFECRNMVIEIHKKIPEKLKRGTRMYEIERLIGPHPIRHGEKVLDIGCGGHPLPWSSVVLDKYPNSMSDRPGEKLETNGKPFIHGDIQYLPFNDQSFDFVNCSQVLEHVEDPVLACKELQRVASRGYIGTPQQIADVLHNYLFLHRWAVQVVEVASKYTLIFREYSEQEKKGTNGAESEFNRLMNRKYCSPYFLWERQNYEFFGVHFYWDQPFDCWCFRKNGQIDALIAGKVIRNISQKMLTDKNPIS